MAATLAFASSARAKSSSAFTDFETITEALFPTTGLQISHRRPTPAEAKVVELARSGAIGLIEAAGPAWFQQIAAPNTPTRSSFRDTLDMLKRVPIWLCSGDECASCGGDQAARGCARAKMLGESVGIVASLHPCFIRASSRCKASQGLPTRASSHELIEQMVSLLGTAAHFKAHGLADSRSRVAAVKKAGAALSKTMASVRAISSACPGPFPLSAIGFLRQTGHLSDIGPFAEQCAQRLLAPFAKSPLPDACRHVVDPSRFKKTMTQGLLWSAPQVARCDSFCEALTCGERDARVPRAMRFGNHWVLSVPPDACDGARPVVHREFLERMVMEVARPETLKIEAGSKAVERCASALLPSEDPPTLPKSEAVPVELPDGPDIRLIE